MDWEKLLTGFGFKFRSLVNLLGSCYLLAAVLPYFGYGESGPGNLSIAVRSIKLTFLSEWISETYRLLGAGTPSKELKFVLIVWLVLICLCLVGEYKDSASSNLIPNSAFASALIWALWVDLVSPGSIVNSALGVIVLALIVIVLMNKGIHIPPSHDFFSLRGWFDSEGWFGALAAFVGILSAFFYVVIAPPLWLAGSDHSNQTNTFERGFNAALAVSAKKTDLPQM